MAQPIGTPESLEEMVFPFKGIDLSTELSSQIPGTTPLGKNVRVNEPLTLRARGGSRSGLSKYIADQSLTAGTKIQHLNIIVDPTTDALLTDDPTGDTVDDPSTNNLSQRNPPPARKVRKGGSAQQPNRNKKKKQSGKITRVQSTFTSGTFALAVTKGNLIVAFVEGINGTVTSVTDTAGNSYTQIATSASQTGFNGAVYQQTMWWAIANNSGPPLTVSSDQDVQVCVEYTKSTSVFTGNPFDSSAVNGAAPNTTNTTMNLGTVAVAGTGELVIAFFGGDYLPAGAGIQIDNTFEFTPVSVGQAVTASGSGANPVLGAAWVAAGASFKST